MLAPWRMLICTFHRYKSEEKGNDAATTHSKLRVEPADVDVDVASENVTFVRLQIT